MQEVRPTVFASLPRFFEKIHARAMADLDASSAAERESFQKALSIGRQIVSLRQDRAPIPIELQSKYESVALPELSRVKQYFGGDLRLATSGGAPLPREVAEFFAAANIPILQAYGLTENICVAFNRADDYRFGTVGKPMPRCEVVVAEDKEILVRSPMMFSGYYKQPAETAAVMHDGWLRTGDLGELDAYGFLLITGRKKELIITSTGKNISPSLLENMIKEHHLISHALVFGEGKSYLVALITLNESEAGAFAGRHGITYQQFDELVSHPAVLSEIEKMIESVNRRVSSTEAIRRFLILNRDFQVEMDEITPTMKLKRDIVTRRNREAIEELYSADKPTEVSC
jgi:long-chain acyl-CoA synthetase